MNATKTEWLFIVNPKAGSGKTMKEWIPAEYRLDRLGILYSTAYTNHRRHAMKLAYDAAEEGYRHFAAVGGDGSLHETFNGIMKWCHATGTNPEEFKLAVIPIGSGNDWIKEFDVPHDVNKAIDLIFEDSFKKMDIIQVKTVGGKVSYMANIGGLGFDSHVSKRVNLQKASGRRSKMIYLNALRYTFTHAMSFNIQVIADGKEMFSGPLYSIALGNGKYSGGGLRQVPLAVSDDGLLDVMICPKVSIFRLFRELPRLLQGTINEADCVISFRCKELEVVPLDTQSQDIIELDGEIEGRLPMTVSVTGESINALCGLKK